MRPFTNDRKFYTLCSGDTTKEIRMKYDDFTQKSDELVSAMRDTDDEAEKLRLKEAWWDAAVDVFNEEIAGDITLADGRNVHIPEINRK